MRLPDVNVLVHAHRPDAPDHERSRLWIEEAVASEEPLGLSDLVLSGFVRIVTHPRIFTRPTPPEVALDAVERLRSQPGCVPINPGPRHWPVFVDLCRSVSARGNLVPDAYLAALAIEHGCEWVTLDRDFTRFPGLRWRHPFDD